MVYLTLVFCLMSSPQHCQEQHPSSEPVTLMECVLKGQTSAQYWLADHPKWILARWRCDSELATDRRA